MINNAAGYYLVPPVWIKDRAPESAGDIDPRSLDEEVLRHTLSTGIIISVQRQGLFMFDFTGWNPGKSNPESNSAPNFNQTAKVILARTEVMNAHQVCLHSSLDERQSTVHPKMIIRPDDVISKKNINDSGMGFGRSPLALALTLSPYRGAYPDLPFNADWRIFLRTVVIDLETVRASLKTLDDIITHPSKIALEVVALLNHAAAFYEEHNYPLALITGWTICEWLLSFLWNSYLEANRTRDEADKKIMFINAERKEKLVSSDFTASIKSEFLSLAGQLPFELFQNLNTTRRARNGWLHLQKDVTKENAELAVNTAREMIREVLSMPLQLTIYMQIHH